MFIPYVIFDLAEVFAILRPLSLYVVGITAYGVFVFHFYRFLASKDIFNLDLDRHNHARHRVLRKTIALAFYVFRSLVVFPVLVFFWFIVMAGLLYLMAKNQTVDGVLLAAMGVVGAIRVSAFYNKQLAIDLAKILPYALLGIVLIDNSLIQIPGSTESVLAALSNWGTMAYYLVAVVALEFVMRMTFGAYGLLRRRYEGADAGGDLEPEPRNGDLRSYRRREDFGAEVPLVLSPVEGRAERTSALGGDESDSSFTAADRPHEEQWKPSWSEERWTPNPVEGGLSSETEQVLEWVRRGAMDEGEADPKPEPEHPPIPGGSRSWFAPREPADSQEPDSDKSPDG